MNLTSESACSLNLLLDFVNKSGIPAMLLDENFRVVATSKNLSTWIPNLTTVAKANRMVSGSIRNVNKLMQAARDNGFVAVTFTETKANKSKLPPAREAVLSWHDGWFMLRLSHVSDAAHSSTGLDVMENSFRNTLGNIFIALNAQKRIVAANKKAPCVNELEQTIEIITANAMLALHASTWMIDFNRFSCGLHTNAVQAADISGFFSKIKAILLPMTHELEIEVRFDLPLGEICGQIDMGMLETIVVNLISNACMFSPPDSTVIISVKAVSRGDGSAGIDYPAKRADMLEVVVKDSGPGIAPEDMENIFQPYYTKTPDGLDDKCVGLGLNIAQLCANAMGGTLKITSSAGKGTRAKLLVPLYQDETLPPNFCAFDISSSDAMTKLRIAMSPCLDRARKNKRRMTPPVKAPNEPGS